MKMYLQILLKYKNIPANLHENLDLMKMYSLSLNCYYKIVYLI